MGDLLQSRLREMQKTHRLMGDVRGMGLMVATELVKDRETKALAVAERDAVVQGCFEKGLLVLGCGESAVRFMPPLTLSKKEAEEGLDIFEAALSEVEKNKF